MSIAPPNCRYAVSLAHFAMGWCMGLSALASGQTASQEIGVFTSDFEPGLFDAVRNVRIPTGDTVLYARMYAPATQNGASVVLQHGCGGMWSNDQLDTQPQAAILKWALRLQQSGYVVVAVDSYTSRTPAGVSQIAFQNQCTGTLYGGAVNPYTTRPRDADAAILWLRYHFGIAATQRMGLLGWSQGAQAVLVRAAETSRELDQSLYATVAAEAQAIQASVAFYPGCGTDLGFIANGHLVESFWRAHRDLHLNLAQLDPLAANCGTRASIAQNTYGAIAGSGHAVDAVTYPGATHSFDGSTNTWPTSLCPVPTAATDECAARDADIRSLEFFEQRLR